jgi:NAD(P)-dependent dehydrogenase (short-subunit alcohol dehydrogenase family)
VALAFAREGADVVLHYASNRTGAEDAAAACEALGVRAFIRRADLASPQACLALVDEAAARLGGLDILVNNSGVTEKADFLAVTPEDFDRLYHINIRGQFFCAQQAVRHMRRAGRGVLVNLTSVLGLAGVPGVSVYAGTKGAIIAWSRQLAVELAPEIRVNAVAPGMIDVPRQAITDPAYDPVRDGRLIPLQRAGRPEDIAGACVFLASEAASFLTGHVLVVDGGTTAWISLGAARTWRDAPADR